VGVGTLTDTNPKARELVTEILDETLWWSTLKLVVEFLHAKTVEKVRVEFGFVLDRDIAGKPQGRDQVVELADLESFIRAAIDEGTIERKGPSDFLFYPLGSELTFMLCNDADLHFASTEPPLLAEVGCALRASGIKVFDAGRPI
jgi:hypothetical protein